MINQNTDDALYSVAYVENYLDCVENLPDEIQRFLTRMHELDINYRNYLKDLCVCKELLEREDLEVAGQRKAFYKLEQTLISLQEVGDEKVEIGQQINDLIDSKYRSLDQDLRNLDFFKEAEPPESTKESIRECNQISSGSGGSRNESGSDRPNGNGGGGERGQSGGGGSSGGERASKRARRSRADNEPIDPPPAETRSATAAGASSSNNSTGTKTSGGTTGGNKSGSNTSSSKKKKRKCRQREETPPREEEVIHDIDEPTYCLCDQISYGEMILCDNDLCPIEWFHFVCVSLTTKPKGKWFCPKCRGDKPNVMKPKSQFLKELERSSPPSRPQRLVLWQRAQIEAKLNQSSEDEMRRSSAANPIGHDNSLDTSKSSVLTNDSSFETEQNHNGKSVKRERGRTRMNGSRASTSPPAIPKRSSRTRSERSGPSPQANNGPRAITTSKRVKQLEPDTSEESESDTYCICDEPAFGEMILCDNDKCLIKWFHFSCVSLESKPSGAWYCPVCRSDTSEKLRRDIGFDLG